MKKELFVGNETFDLLDVGLVGDLNLTKVPFPLCALLGENVRF